jgi:flagellin
VSISSVSNSLNSISNNNLNDKLELHLPEQDETSNKIIETLSLIDNDNTLTSTYSISNILKNRTNAVSTAFKIASSGAAYSQITNLALFQQNEMLTSIKNKLEDSKLGKISDKGRDAIRKDIANILKKFDNIASDTHYHQKYTLQKSDTDISTSEIVSFQISEFPPITLSSISIQSNSTGLGLDTLKNLTQNSLTYQVANTQSGIVDTAIQKIDDFQSQYTNLLSTLKQSVSSLNNQHFNLKSDANILSKEYDYKKTKAFDKAKILSEIGKFTSAQANTNQTSVIDLLKL